MSYSDNNSAKYLHSHLIDSVLQDAMSISKNVTGLLHSQTLLNCAHTSISQTTAYKLIHKFCKEGWLSVVWNFNFTENLTAFSSILKYAQTLHFVKHLLHTDSSNTKYFNACSFVEKVHFIIFKSCMIPWEIWMTDAEVILLDYL